VKGRRRPLQQARTTAASDILRLCCSRVEQAGGASASLRSLPCCAGNERDDCVRTGRWRWAAGCFGGGGGGWGWRAAARAPVCSVPVQFLPYHSECGGRAGERNDCVGFPVSYCGEKNAKNDRHRPRCPVAFLLPAPVRTV
jgi:hypothetical protein